MIFDSINSNNYTMKTKFNGILTLLLALVVQISFAQEKTVSGTVSDKAGTLPGVSVLIKGTTTGTETDFDGKYSIKSKAGDILVFSYLGYTSVEKKVGSSSTINVTMKEDDNVLDEVVVTALGIKRKPKELPYSVQSLKGGDVTKTKSVNVATAMVGKISGLQINTINNSVNPSTRVVLRGSRSLLGNNQALIVVDGFPSSRNTLDRINPEDIENVSVLKGANAAALYGSEARNGVIILTTKKGRGKLKATLVSTLQMESVAYLPELQDQFGAGGFPDGTLYPLENVNWGPRFDGRLVDASETLDNGEVWQVPFTPIKDVHKDFFDTGVTMRHGITLSGGDQTSDFLMSLDQTNTTGTVPKDRYNRTNFRFKASRKYNKLKLGGNFNFFRSHSDQVGSGGRQGRPVYWNVLNTPLHLPLSEMKNWQDGKFTRNEVSYFRFYENPYFIIDTQRNYGDISQFNIVADAEYAFSDNFKISFKAGYNGFSSYSKRQFGGFTYDFHLANVYSEMDPYGASTSTSNNASQRVNTDLIATYTKDINEDIKVTALVGQNMRLNSSTGTNVNGSDLIIKDFWDVSTRKGDLGGSESASKYRKLGFYANLTVGYKDYLFLTVTGRNDITSTLAKENNSFFYPSAGVSFVVSDAFPEIKSDNGLSYLKASFSFSKTGSDPGSYAINNFFSAPGNFPYGNIAGLSQSSRIADPALKPEFTNSIEGGVEFGLFNNKINTNITVYKNNSVDQIIPVNISHASGATSSLTNIGELEDIGLELDINANIFRTDDFSWDVGVNYFANKTKVISLTDGVDELDIGGFASAQVIARVGESYPLLRTTDYTRDDQGRVVVGANGDPIRDPNNHIQGKTTPDYTIGLNTTIRYKNFSLYAVMDYRTGHVFYNSLVDALEFTGLTQHSASSGRQPFVFPNSVYSDGAGGFTPNTNRLTTGGGNAFWDEYNNVKSNYVTDATTLKLREVLLSYNLDGKMLKSAGIDNVSVGVFGRNLLTFRPKSNVYTDPEFNFTSGNAVGVGTQAQTPPTRQYGVTLTVKF